MIFETRPKVQRESSGAPLSVDEATLLINIVHSDRCFNVHHCGREVDVTNMGRWLEVCSFEIQDFVIHAFSPSPYAEICHSHAAEMHNDLEISAALH